MSERSIAEYQAASLRVACRQNQGWPEPADLREVLAIPYGIGERLLAPDGSIHCVRVSDGFDGKARCECGWSDAGHWYDIRANGRRHMFAAIGPLR